MGRQHHSPNRDIYGILGNVPHASKLQAEWNVYFKEKGIDAFMDRYPTTVQTLPERLSEMFHFDRRMYIVGKGLKQALMPLLDAVHGTADGKGGINVVVNRGGVLKGFHSSSYSPKEILTELEEKRLYSR